MKDIIVYHGSRGGIDGEIQPISRIRCDFGKGFYTGTSPEQAKGIVVDDPAPIFYTLKFKLSEIPEEKILVLKDTDWIYCILANRKKVQEFNELSMAREWLNNIENYDVIIGSIADDRMNMAMERFSQYAITDKGLMECLRTVDYGLQIVAKTEYACSKIEIISERSIFGKEADDIRKYMSEKRNESYDIVRKMSVKYQREGKYLNEIIAEEQQKISSKKKVYTKKGKRL